MKKDFTTAILAAIIGVIVAYFLTNLLFSEIEDFSISSVDPNLVINLASPNEEIFNFRAVNPTVEVYVGDCDEYDSETGECKEDEESEESDDEESKESNNEESKEPNNEEPEEPNENKEEETEEEENL